MSQVTPESTAHSAIIRAIEKKKLGLSSIIESPMLYCSRQTVTKILTRIKLFEMIREVQGSIVECGVYKGDSLLTFFHMSTIFEPFSFTRKIIGFDSFSGFPSISARDNLKFAKVHHLSDVDLSHIQRVVEIQELNKALPELNRIELIKGNVDETIPQYLKDNSHLIVSLLYLDFDLYEPTKIALESLLSKVTIGGIVAFDQINQSKWKGETQALDEVIGINNVALKKFSFDPHVSYFQVEKQLSFAE